MARPDVTYKQYVERFGGELSEEAFAAALPLAEAHVVWLCWPREPRSCDEKKAWQRAVYACVDVFAEYGSGSVGGFSVGDFKITNYENKGTTGTELATEAATRALIGTTLLFCGVC